MAYGKGIEEVLSIQETMEDINAKDPSTGNYAIPTEVVVQKYLKERVNPQLPTTSILAALDHRKWEQKQQAEAQGPQQSVLEETITEADMAMRPPMNPMMPQGIQQGQPRPMPRQMPGQMAGLQRPPMPRRVPPQQRMGTGIPMMAAAGGYVPNFADGGIIGYKERGIVNRFDPDARPYTDSFTDFSLTKDQVMALPDGVREDYIKRLDFQNKMKTASPKKLQDVDFKSSLEEVSPFRVDKDLEAGDMDVYSAFKMTDEDLGVGGKKLDVDSVIEESTGKLKKEPTKKGSEEDIKIKDITEEDIEIDKNKERDKINKLLEQENLAFKKDDKELDRDFEGAVFDTGVVDTSVYEPKEAIEEGDAAVAAYERRMGVNPFTAIAEKFQEETGQEIEDGKKFMMGRMIFNFGSELAKTGRLGDAAVAAGKDVNTDMTKIENLKKQQRKHEFEIAKLDNIERTNKAKLGADVEAKTELMNMKKTLQKNADMLKQEEINIKRPYYKALGVKAKAEAKYYDAYSTAQTGAIDKSYEIAVEQVFGSANEFANWRKRDNQIRAIETSKNIPYEEAAIEFYSKFGKDSAILARTHIQNNNDLNMTRQKLMQDFANRGGGVRPPGPNPQAIGTYNPRDGLTTGIK